MKIKNSNNLSVIISRISAILFAILFAFTLIITSLQAVLNLTPGYFKQEFIKYDVLDDVNGEMKIEDAVCVMNEALQYLNGKRDNLAVYTKIDGRRSEFFSKREKAHMKDVKALFKIGKLSRNLAAFICLSLLIFFAAALSKSENCANIKTNALRSFAFTEISLNSVAAIFIVVISFNFDKAFDAFHHIIFDNDLWILDPARDNMINLLPRDFFIDTAIRTVSIYSVIMTVAVIIAVILGRSPSKSDKVN